MVDNDDTMEMYETKDLINGAIKLSKTIGKHDNSAKYTLTIRDTESKRVYVQSTKLYEPTPEPIRICELYLMFKEIIKELIKKGVNV